MFEERALAHARSRSSAGTCENYEKNLQNWLAWCATHKVNAAKPTLEGATEYRDELIKSYAPGTVRRFIAELSAMYEAVLGTDEDAVTWNPFKKLPRPPADLYNRTPAIAFEDSQKLLDVVAQDKTPLGLRDHAILRLIYHTGIRRSSVSRLKRRKIFKRDNVLMARVYIKGNKEREIALPEPAAEALEDWLESSPPGEDVFDLNDNAITAMVIRRAKRAGLKTTPHQFRAAFITEALDAGLPLYEVQAGVHHADPRTTLRYDRSVRGTGVMSAVENFRKGKK